MISALSNWEAHTSATEGETRCEKFDNCPFMWKMPGLVKITLGGASMGNDNNDGIDTDENKELNEVDPDKDIDDADADLESQGGRVTETENCTEYELLIAHDEDEPRNDEDEVDKICCCCFL